MIYSDRIMHRVGAHRLMLIALIMTALQRLAVFSLPFIVTIMVVRFIGGVALFFFTIAFFVLVCSRTQSFLKRTLLAVFTISISGIVGNSHYLTSGDPL